MSDLVEDALARMATDAEFHARVITVVRAIEATKQRDGYGELADERVVVVTTAAVALYCSDATEVFRRLVGI